VFSEEIIEQGGARAADVKIAGGAGSEARANFCHGGKLTGGRNAVNGAL